MTVDLSKDQRLLDVRGARLSRRMGQRQLAEKLGLPVSTLARVERGLSPVCDDLAEKLGSALEVALNRFELLKPTAGEGYVTALANRRDVRIPRRHAHDPALRPVIDLFCGVGGFSTGFESTGEFEVVAGVDLLGDRLGTFTSNHGAATAFGTDIRALDPTQILEENPTPFIVLGGPPCQGFSSIRPFRNVDWKDQRNNLGEEFCRLVNGLKPDWLIFENVVGLLSYQGGQVFRSLTQAFEELGYRTSARVMNSAHYGLPQRRERLIIVGSRKGKAFQWPKPTHLHDQRSMAGRSRLLMLPEPGMFDDLRPALTTMEAIGDLPPVASGCEVNQYDSEVQNRYQEMMRDNARELTMHYATKHSPKMMEIISHAGSNIKALPTGLVTSGFSTCYSRLAANEPANTITVNFVHPASNRCIHPFQDRALTPREGARLQSFPDTFVFEGSRSQVVKQIGNAVPPLLGKILAEAVLDSD